MANKEKDKKKLLIIRRLSLKKLSVRMAADALELSERQIWRLLKRYEEEGRKGLTHRAKGRPSSNSIAPEIRERVLSLVRDKYRFLGPTKIARELMANDGLKISRETLRLWMISRGLWLNSRKAR